MSPGKAVNKEWKIMLLLLVCSFSIYFFYFHNIFLNINSVLSSITSDTIKNYFTFVYHIKNDSAALHFSGMAYPYGEHVVYTDCQPILTFLLRLLPFANNYLIGTLHSLIFLSYIVSPLILYRIFRLLELDTFSAFFMALAIGLLSPQFLKINAGHHGLAYACIIPLSILLILNHIKSSNNKTLANLFLYHCLLYLLHPYLGFSVSLFAFMALLYMQFVYPQPGKFTQLLGNNLLVGVVPTLLFKLFMLLTDKHPERTNEPYGLNMMIENIDSMVAPVFGPMKGIMELFFNNRINHYEGHTYLGAFSLLLLTGLLISIPFTFRLLHFRKDTQALFTSSFVLLLFAFGLHSTLFETLGLNLAFMNQFRATCRFAWFFYYSLPILLVPVLNGYVKKRLNGHLMQKTLVVFPVLFFCSNLTEAHYMFKMDKEIFWKFRNFFDEKQLNAQEHQVLDELRKRPMQAIIPLPLFHSGSEMYDRSGFNNSMIPSMIYSSHSGIPILSVLMSRTSMLETENSLNLLNSYKKDRPALKLVGEGDFMLIKTEPTIFPDEERILKEAIPFLSNDSLEIGFISKRDFLKRKLDREIVTVTGNASKVDSNMVVFIPFENRKPFTEANMNEFEKVFTLDSNTVKPGKYVVSMRYYYTLRNYHALACDMIITETGASDFYWKYILPFRFLSGFYDGYAIMEAGIEIERNKKYEFIIKGREDRSYRISDFMLRPANKTVRVISLKGDTVYNNFPN